MTTITVQLDEAKATLLREKAEEYGKRRDIALRAMHKNFEKIGKG